MPHERIVGVPIRYEDPEGETGWGGTGVLDVHWGRDTGDVTFALTLLTEGTEEVPPEYLPMPENHGVTVGSWSQVNRLMGVLRRARDHAFGEPE